MGRDRQFPPMGERMQRPHRQRDTRSRDFLAVYSRDRSDLHHASIRIGTRVALAAGVAGGANPAVRPAMPYGMYISGEGAATAAQRLEVIANNLANVDTVGFKPDVATFQARFAEAIQMGEAQAGDQSINDLGGGVKLIDVITDHSAGQFKETGGRLDLAIAGNGYFHVRGDDGEQYLTRAGNFTLDSQGRLVTQNGQRPVLDQAGGEITLDPSQPFAISSDGFISQAGSLVALGMSQPASVDELVKVGHNLFRPLGQVTTVPLAERNVRQGFLEMSGANPVRQMMSMIETTRAFEANTRMIQNQDTMLGALISRVLQA
jgi:flagellar basal-body rod protein FlgF/flagellar basal-body rod protein FlgG